MSISYNDNSINGKCQTFQIMNIHCYDKEKALATHSVLLPGESQDPGSLVGCRLWGPTESDMTEVT